MKKIIKEGYTLERFTLPKDEALKLEADEPYKQELINELPQGEEISFYRQGDFVDLCAGPHLYDLKKIKAIKLTNCTGAYWRGDAKNKMLQRIYGVSFPKASELEEHLARLEEAKKRDHNKLGRELGIFTTVDVIGQGLPVMLPNALSRMRNSAAAGCLPRPRLWQNPTFTRFRGIGITIWTECSLWATPQNPTRKRYTLCVR